MHRSVRIALYRHGQPDDETWARVGDVVGQLANEGVRPTHMTDGVAVKYVFEREDDDRVIRLRRELAEAHGAWGVVWQEHRVIEVDPEDYRTADLLVVVGVGLDGQTGPFLLNEDEAIGRLVPCPECGNVTTADRPVVAPLRVDETRLTAPTEASRPGTASYEVRRPARTWDLVTLPNSGVVASRRLLDVLNRAGATGWHAQPVRTSDGRQSEQLGLLEATAVDARPCLEHSRIGPEGVCATCGLVRDDRAAPVPLHVRRSDFEGRDLVSTGRFPHGPLLVTRALFDTLAAAGLDGVEAIEPRSLCDH